MAKKLFAVWLLSTVIIFSSFSADTNPKIDTPAAAACVSHTAAGSAQNVTAGIVDKTVQEIAAERRQQQYLDGLAAYIRHVNPSVPEPEAAEMAACFVESAEQYQVDEKIVMAVAQTESAYDRNAVSSEDFKGLMQTGDILAEHAGYAPERLFEPEVSIRVGASYLADKLEEFGDLRLALTAYNQGSGAVRGGCYTTGYAETAIARAGQVEDYLREHGYAQAP